MALDQTELAQIVGAVISALRADGAASPKASSRFLPKGSKAEPSDLAANDAKLVAAFARKGFRVTLMDRNDPAKPYDVRPFKGWLEQGRIVRKGSKGIRGLFHVTQTDPLPGKAPAKPPITTEQKSFLLRRRPHSRLRRPSRNPLPDIACTHTSPLARFVGGLFCASHRATVRFSMSGDRPGTGEFASPISARPMASVRFPIIFRTVPTRTRTFTMRRLCRVFSMALVHSAWTLGLNVAGCSKASVHSKANPRYLT